MCIKLLRDKVATKMETHHGIHFFNNTEDINLLCHLHNTKTIHHMLAEKETHFKGKQQLIDVMLIVMMMAGPATSCGRFAVEP